jgi:hypothetical protein
MLIAPCQTPRLAIDPTIRVSPTLKSSGIFIMNIAILP